jgi:predicted dehydrogenase
MSENINRREFIKKSTTAAAGIAIATLSASSYSKIMGANDRISIGIVGASARGRGALMPEVFALEKELNIELTTVCDIWKVNLERGVELIKKNTGRTAKTFKSLDEMLNQKDIDAVIVAVGDPQHALLLKQVVEAGKDCYCEKPMAINVKHAKVAVAAVKKSKRIVQLGTQGLSSPSLWGLKKFIASGRLGKISRVEQSQSYWGPRWRGREDVNLVKEPDTDWKVWLLDYPPRKFDPKLYFEYRVYKDFSTGIAGQWMSHRIAATALAMGEGFPYSATSDGGNFVWKDGREIPDVFVANLVYPSGWLYTYACNFGTDYPGVDVYYGLNGTIEAERGYTVTSEGGGIEDTPENREREKRTRASGTGSIVNPNKIKGEIKIEPEGGTEGSNSHMREWINCMRSRKNPSADVMTGYYHSVACIMAHQSGYLGKKLYWDSKKEEIVDSPPKA